MTPTPTTAPANDNHRRPASFDKMLLDAMPYIKRRAKHYVGPQDADDLISETVTRILTKWALYRSEYKFTVWLTYQMRKVVAERRAKPGAAGHANIDKCVIAVAAPQEDYLQVSRALRIAARSQHGEILALTVAGHSGVVIGEMLGITKQRVNQRLKHVRRRMSEAA